MARLTPHPTTPTPRARPAYARPRGAHPRPGQTHTDARADTTRSALAPTAPVALTTPRMAPLNVPRAHRLPTGYVTRPVEEGVMDAACTLALHLTQAGLIPRRAPRSGETPESASR